MPSKSKSPKRGLKKSLSKSSLASSLSTYSGEDDELRPNKERTRKPDSRAQRWEVLGAATLEDARQRAAESLAAGHFLASRNRGQCFSLESGTVEPCPASQQLQAPRKVRDDVVLWISSADETTTGAASVQRNRGLQRYSTRAKPGPPGLAQCAELLRGVASAVEQHGYRGSRSHGVPLLLQLSCFRGGSAALGYARHVDCNFQSMAELGVLGWLRASGSRSRVLTAMVYLNDPHWTGAEGGELRVYHGMQWFDVEDNAGQWRDYTDILPRGGTLVIFDSRLVQHQVLPPRGRNRFALTCWILGRSDGTRRAF
eukprot:s239_g19.t3